jgi:hypothetical protein
MAAWPWLALAGLGVFHGLNPAMGWLFAVALGLQRRSMRAVFASLVPIALGHAAAIAVVVAALSVLQAFVELRVLQGSAALVLVGFGLHRLVARHRGRVGMQVGFGELREHRAEADASHSYDVQVSTARDPSIARGPALWRSARRHLRWMDAQAQGRVDETPTLAAPGLRPPSELRATPGGLA